MKKVLLWIAMGFLFFANSASAATLTMDELPWQSIDGLSINGVTFSFTVDGLSSLDAYYNSGGPGYSTYIHDPSIEGDSKGILGIHFSSPTPTMSFGVALSNDIDDLKPGFTVDLFDSKMNLLSSNPVDTYILTSFTEAQFVYSGDAVSFAKIDFNEAAAMRFAFDNLNYTPTPTPIPAAIYFLGTGLVGLAGIRRRKRT